MACKYAQKPQRMSFQDVVANKFECRSKYLSTKDPGSQVTFAHLLSAECLSAYYLSTKRPRTRGIHAWHCLLNLFQHKMSHV